MPIKTDESLAYELGRVQGYAEHMEMALQAALRYLKHRQAVEDTWIVQNTLSSIERGLEAYKHITDSAANREGEVSGDDEWPMSLGEGDW